MRERFEAANLASHMENPGVLLSFLLLVAATRLSGQQGPPSRPDFARIGVEQGRPSSQSGFDIEAASRFARLALDCVHKEYPNKISHSLNSDADVAPPRKLTPSFYGCYDWHSSVTDTGFSRAWPALFLTRLSHFRRAQRCSRA
jgi:hypothetical protein